MLTVDGLFGAGDTVGGSAHKFSSGSFTEGSDQLRKLQLNMSKIWEMITIEVNDKQCDDFKEDNL